MIAPLKLVMPPDPVAPAGDVAGHPRFLINGWMAEIRVWTADEWASLSDRPVDARRSPNGCWSTLRWADDPAPICTDPHAAADRVGPTLYDPGDRP